MENSQFFSEIQASASAKFDLVETGETIAWIKECAPKDLHEYSVIRARRPAKTSKYCRTLLVASLGSKSQLEAALRWTAEVRDGLIEPETSDLYLFLLIPDILPHEIIQLEANEQFCRKYVIREVFNVQQALRRTFLAKDFEYKSSENLSDPVLVAFRETQTAHDWLSEDYQNTWLKAFLSTDATSEIITQLLSDPVPDTTQ